MNQSRGHSHEKSTYPKKMTHVQKGVLHCINLSQVMGWGGSRKPVMKWELGKFDWISNADLLYITIVNLINYKTSEITKAFQSPVFIPYSSQETHPGNDEVKNFQPHKYLTPKVFLLSTI